MAIVEYLYVDEARLNSYVSQIEGGLVSYDKVPIYDAELSITGPKAKATQQRFPREKTTHEKIKVLRSY